MRKLYKTSTSENYLIILAEPYCEVYFPKKINEYSNVGFHSIIGFNVYMQYENLGIYMHNYNYKFIKKVYEV